MEQTGEIMWWSERDQNGIIVDRDGNEFYFDRSVLGQTQSEDIKRKSQVLFLRNEKIRDCLCAHNIKFAKE